MRPVPELVNWSRSRMSSTTRASICPAVSMMGISGSVRVFRSSSLSKNRTCRWLSRTCARKSRSNGLCAHCFRLLSSRNWGGRASHCSSALRWIMLFSVSPYILSLNYYLGVYKTSHAYLALRTHSASCLSCSNSQTSSFKEAQRADQHVSALYPALASGLQVKRLPSERTIVPSDGIWKWQKRLFMRGGRPRKMAIFLSAE
jgi:hypothetical protein